MSTTNRLNGIGAFQPWGNSDPGTSSFPALGGDPLGSVLFPGEYELVMQIKHNQLVPACYGTEVTTELLVETVASGT